MKVATISVLIGLALSVTISGCTGPQADDSNFGQPPGETGSNQTSTPSSSPPSSAPSTPSRSITVKWQKALDGDFWSVAVSPTGELVAAGFTPNVEEAPGEVRGFDSTGAEVFTLVLDDDSPPDEFFSYIPRALSVSLGANGGAVATQNGVVHRFSAQGAELWQAIVKWNVAFEDANVAMHPNGGVFASAEKRIAFLDSSGAEKWTYTAGQTVRDVAVKSDGSECWAASEDNFVYKLNCATGSLIGEADLGEEIQRLTLSKSGTHFVAVLGDEYGFSSTTALYKSDGTVVSQVEGVGEGAILGDASGFVASASSEFRLYSTAGVKQGTAKARDAVEEIRAASEAKVVVGVADDSRLYYLTVS